ncbi:hypothetical protein ACHAW5_002169 [Stephanodiscus triporus]|uniref:Uncharacterized protein n=1 Tax=Stephanodiscus triporus TaxID=2934178 RepID=A0ABD3QA00_9STRA
MSIPTTHYPPATVESASRSSATTISARATFPFKPASTLIALQKLQADVENRSYLDACHYVTPPCSRPRPDMTESTLQQNDIFFIEIDEDSTDETSNGQSKVQSNDSGPSAPDNIRRTTVAIAGGTILSVGLVCIPLPIIPGSLIAYGGLMILATEFDSAKKAMDTVNKSIEKWRADGKDKETNAAGDEGGGNPKSLSNEADKSKEDVGGANGRSAKNEKMIHYLGKVFMLNSDYSDSYERKDAVESKHYASGQTLAPVSPTCHSQLFGCDSLSFHNDHDDENDKTHVTHARFQRLGSDESVPLNALDQRNELSHGNDDDSFWVTFGCSPFLNE